MRLKMGGAFVLVIGATVPVVLSPSDSVLAAGKLSPSERRCFEVSGDAGGAALVNLTPVQAGALGNGQLVSSNVSSPPVASNVNFRPGRVDPNVAVTSIGAHGEVCFVNSVHTDVHLVADHLGTIAASVYTAATPSGAPDRRVDTRFALGGGKVGPSGRRCFSVSGDPGDAAIVNLTPVLADGVGDGQLLSSDVTDLPIASNVNYGPGVVDPNVAIAKIGADGEVCFANSGHSSVHLVADHLGTIATSAYTAAKPSGAPDRRVDTRSGLGGGKIGPSGRRCFSVSGAPGDAAVVNLTPVLADGVGDGQLISSDVTDPPIASNVNYRPGTVDPNVAIAPVGADGEVCYVNSTHSNVHLVADHLGTIGAEVYAAASPGGAPDRSLDTREAPAEFIELDRSGSGETVRSEEIDFRCWYLYSALAGTPLHEIELVVNGLDPFVPRFKGDYPHYRNTGSVGIQVSAPRDMFSPELPFGSFQYYSDWADETGSVGWFNDNYYPKSTSVAQLQSFDATVRLDQWFADPLWDGDSFPEPDNSITYEFSATCRPKGAVAVASRSEVALVGESRPV